LPTLLGDLGGNHKQRTMNQEPMKQKTLCPYCGVGCGLEVLPPAQPGKAVHRDSEGNPIWQVRGDRAHPSSKGMVCVKGATVTEATDNIPFCEIP